MESPTQSTSHSLQGRSEVNPHECDVCHVMCARGHRVMCVM